MKMNPIYVTKSYVPPLKEYIYQLDDIWKSGNFSNGGEKNRLFTKELKKYLNVENIILTPNGTLPLQIAIKQFSSKNKNEIITTPFSYVATTSSIFWENCKPIFVDINSKYLTIDENLIEKKINENTSAILATHVYGNPCNVDFIEEISKKYNIPVIYDGAHAFGVKYNRRSLLSYGDISTCSFHATKLMHTAEGGSIILNNSDLFGEIFRKSNFGHKTPYEFDGVGINAKMSELSAALGLVNIKYIDKIKKLRKDNFVVYDENLSFTRFKKPQIRKNTQINYSYYPLIFDSEEILLHYIKRLKSSNIFPRRYFYPSLNTLNYIETYESMKISEDVSKRILCLPVSPHYDKSTINYVVEKINQINI